MQKEIYIVTFSSANYCGAPEYCAVMATSEFDAMSNSGVLDYAEDFYREQDEEQFLEENENEEPDMGYATIESAVRLIGSDFEEFYANEKQRFAFYPMVG